MKTYTEKEWDDLSARREALAVRLGKVQRPPLEKQLGKSQVKKFLLQQLYGPDGRP